MNLFEPNPECTGPTHLDLIFKYASWVLKSNPEEGVRVSGQFRFTGTSLHITNTFQIFTEDSDERRELDRDKVLNYLQKEQPAAVVPYLVGGEIIVKIDSNIQEFTVAELSETSSRIHDTLAESYVRRVKAGLQNLVHRLKNGIFEDF